MTGSALYHDVLGEVGTQSRASRDKQRLDSDRGSQGDSMDDSRSPTGMLRTNAFCQISLKILHANPPLAKSKD
jgi:hypothetical protein